MRSATRSSVGAHGSAQAELQLAVQVFRGLLQLEGFGRGSANTDALQAVFQMRHLLHLLRLCGTMFEPVRASDEHVGQGANFEER